MWVLAPEPGWGLCRNSKCSVAFLQHPSLSTFYSPPTVDGDGKIIDFLFFGSQRSFLVVLRELGKCIVENGSSLRFKKLGHS